jgi:anaerobic selenocysteine-containing dehydrogenase
MTNHWVDIKNTDLVLIMGGNAAECHPCGFKWVIEAKAHRNAKLIVVDPRFTRSASVADLYIPIRAGSDIAFLGGVMNYLLTNDAIHHDYVANYTDFSFIVREDFALVRQGELGLREGRGRLRQDGSDAAAPTLRVQPPEAALLALHAGDGGEDLRLAAGQVPRGMQADRRDVVAEEHDDHHVRARLDAALHRLADHPRGRDGAAAAREHRRGGRRHERVARPLQHPRCAATPTSRDSPTWA